MEPGKRQKDPEKLSLDAVKRISREYEMRSVIIVGEILLQNRNSFALYALNIAFQL
jgi:hypothetical protein